mgnify:CR=1 FL=1
MNKTKEAYKTIGEVAKELDVPAHVLRFWENKFDRLKLIKPTIVNIKKKTKKIIINIGESNE